jgi:excisionase family DNA binding protein
MPKRQRPGVENDAAIDLGSDVRVEKESGTMRTLSDSEIMKRSEVARLLRCSEPHVVALIEREGLPAFRLGKLWRFRRSEVIAWCERRSNGRRTA